MMSGNGMVEAGSRFDLRTGKSPDAPETASFEGTEATFGWVHSYETGSTVDGPGVRLMLFMSGCFLRCLYCHNPDTWDIKDGTRIELAQAIRRLGDFAPALRSLGGGLTISGGEPLVQIGFTRGLFAAARQLGLHTALDTSGFLGHRADDAYLESVDLVLLDIKSGDPDTYRKVTGCELHPTLRFAERLSAIKKTGLDPIRPRPGPDRRSWKHRESRTIRGADVERGMGRGAALSPNGFFQMENARAGQ
jgi:pyruvate formate lyase activating enzyme